MSTHALLHGGQPRYWDDGHEARDWRYRGMSTRARCRCGAMSWPGISQYAARHKWYPAHRLDVGEDSA